MSVTPEQLYEHHRHSVFRLCLRLGSGDVAWAEDATHDVFVKLLQKIAGLEDTDQLGGWLYRVTVNTCLKRLKRESSVWRRVWETLGSSSTSQDTGSSPERAMALREDLQEALRALQSLPAKERVVFCMRYLDELPQRDIATTLELSEGYVSKLLGRARHRIEQLGWEAPDA